jgi:hypothetical protein
MTFSSVRRPPFVLLRKTLTLFRGNQRFAFRTSGSKDVMSAIYVLTTEFVRVIPFFHTGEPVFASIMTTVFAYAIFDPMRPEAFGCESLNVARAEGTLPPLVDGVVWWDLTMLADPVLVVLVRVSGQRVRRFFDIHRLTPACS